MKIKMPTIEIVSMKSKGLGLKQEDYNFAIIEEPRLESHRGLFYKILLAEKGVMVHLGNPEFINDKGIFFGEKLFDWSKINVNKFTFLPKYKNDVDKILKLAYENSPVNKMCFLTDCQIDNKPGIITTIFRLSDFWKLHDTKGLSINTMYEMYGL